MTFISPYSYRLLLQNKQIGPFDRRTVVGMRMKKLVPKETQVLRSDGLMMTVAQLLVDRMEQSDLVTGKLPAMVGLASVLWPTFTVDFGGSWLYPGAFGLVGKGELRCQDHAVRVSGQRKNVLQGRKLLRFKIDLTDISHARAVPANPCNVVLTLRAGSGWTGQGKAIDVVVVLADEMSASELCELLCTSQP